MEMLNPENINILSAIQKYPLATYSELSEILDIPKTTIYHRVQKLKSQNNITNILSSWIPEKLGLKRYTIFFFTSSLEQLQYLHLSFEESPYTRQFSRFYGSRFGIYARFDVPKTATENFMSFLHELCNRNFCDDFIKYNSTGNRILYQAPVTIFSSEPDSFNLMDFWCKRLECSTQLPKEPEPIDLEKIDPINFLILRDMNLDMKRQQTDMLDEYQQWLKLSPDDEKYERWDTIPRGYRSFVEDYFADKNENALKTDFHRKYNFVRDNLVSYIRLNIPAKFYYNYPQHIIVIKDVPKAEIARIFNLFKENRPPFRCSAEVLECGLYLRTSLPPYYDSRFSYLLHSTFKDFDYFLMDFFGSHGRGYPFYAENFDPLNHKWRDDKDWAVNNVFKRIDYKLQNGKYGEKNNGS